NLQDVGGDLRQRGDVAVALAHRARIDGGAAAGIDRDSCALPTAAIKATRGKPPRRRHAAHVGIGGDPDAAIGALAPQGVALTAARFIVESSKRLVEQTVIVAGVVDRAHAAIGAIGKIGALNEVLAPYLDLIDVQMPRDRVDGALGNISALGAAVAAIGIDRHGVGDDDARRRLVVRYFVGTRAEIDGV